MKPGTAYYRGGARVVVDGIPIRLARKPSAHNLKWSNVHEKIRNAPDTRTGRSAAEKAYYRRQIVAQAKADIQSYADALGISVKAAKARIELQRLAVLANPLLDLSLEFDL